MAAPIKGLYGPVSIWWVEPRSHDYALAFLVPSVAAELCFRGKFPQTEESSDDG